MSLSIPHHSILPPHVIHRLSGLEERAYLTISYLMRFPSTLRCAQQAQGTIFEGVSDPFHLSIIADPQEIQQDLKN